MHLEEMFSSLLICISLLKTLLKFGVKIRISVFGEREKVWILSEFIEIDNEIDFILLRLRNVFLSEKRFISFPADALFQIKENYLKNYFKENQNKKYIQILISNLISPQVLIEINWDPADENVFIFTLYKENEKIENYFKENRLNFKELLNIKKNSQKIIQEFLEPFDLNNKGNLNEKVKEKYYSLIDQLINLMKYEINGNKNFQERIPKKNKKNIFIDDIDDNQENNNIIEQIQFKKNFNVEEKFFVQNNELINQIELNEFNYLFEFDDFPTPDELFKQKVQFNYKLNKDLENFVKENLKSTFNDLFEKNISTEKIYSICGGTISTKAVINNLVCSGFTNPKIFVQKGPPNKRKYNLVYVIDLSNYILFDFIKINIIETIMTLLLAPTIIEENEEIFIDIILNTQENVKILEYNLECNQLKNNSRLNNIINKIIKNVGDSCCPGTCLMTAYNLLLERTASKKIFLITDNNIKNKNEILLALKLVQIFNEKEIDFYAIGVGLFPYGLDKIYPKCFYSKSINNINKCFSIYLNNIPILNPEEIKKNDIMIESYDFSKIFIDKNIDEELKKLIEDEKINLEDFIFNLKVLKLKEVKITPGIINPDFDPYTDGVLSWTYFKNQNTILVVILYLSENDKNIKEDDEITEEKFIKNLGPVFKDKGFEYTIVYNYLDAINELTKEGDCKYIETWIFCSDGSGNTPKGGKPIYYSNVIKNEKEIGRKVTKEDNEKEIIPFLETIAEYNQKGGALFLFCDNFPFVLETNLLLTKYLDFKKYEKVDVNFEMKGNYIRNKNSDGIIYRMNENEKLNAKFDNKTTIETPRKRKRYFPAIGVFKFYEGITLSYAEKIKKENEIELFKPIAYLSDMENLRPFILYYDPKVSEDKNQISRGPIVIHGGLTSAFYEYDYDGTGSIIKSIALWLSRIEERIEDRNKFLIPHINRREISEKIKFDQWNNDKILTYTILILDISGSMKNYYFDLIDMTNQIINIQKEKKEPNENEGVIIFFDDEAKVIVEKKKFKNIEDLKLTDIYNSISQGGTNFKNAFEKAKEFIKIDEKFTSRKVLFLTDGQDSYSDITSLCEDFKNCGFKIYFIGLGNTYSFNNLDKFPHNYKIISNDFEEIKQYIIKNSTI